MLFASASRNMTWIIVINYEIGFGVLAAPRTALDFAERWMRITNTEQRGAHV
jgi:hypothetical protein